LTLSKDLELWAVALWVEKHHGDEGDLYIAKQMDRLLAEGDLDGVAFWKKVRVRLDSLHCTKPACS